MLEYIVGILGAVLGIIGISSIAYVWILDWRGFHYFLRKLYLALWCRCLTLISTVT